MSPIHVDCENCAGHGRLRPNWTLCAKCDGLGYVFAPEAPTYGCKETLSDRRPGEIVELGNGDRGRILRHEKSPGNPTTVVALIGLFDGAEAELGTHFPSETGVRSVDPETWKPKTKADRRKSADPNDPLQQPKR